MSLEMRFFKRHDVTPKTATQQSLVGVSTRIHSSRMRTSRLLPVFPSMHCSEGCTRSQGAVPGLRGCTWSKGAVPSTRGVYLVLGGVSGPRGVYLVRGCTCPGTPPVNRMTDRWKNMALPRTLYSFYFPQISHFVQSWHLGVF